MHHSLLSSACSFSTQLAVTVSAGAATRADLPHVQQTFCRHIPAAALPFDPNPTIWVHYVRRAPIFRKPPIVRSQHSAPTPAQPVRSITRALVPRRALRTKFPEGQRRSRVQRISPVDLDCELATLRGMQVRFLGLFATAAGGRRGKVIM